MSASTPATDQLEPAPELSYQAVDNLIKQRDILLSSSLQLLFDLNSESMMVPKKQVAEKRDIVINNGLKGKNVQMIQGTYERNF